MAEVSLRQDQRAWSIPAVFRELDRSLRLRLLVLTVGILLVMLGTFASVVYLRARRSVESQARAEIQSAYHLVTHRVLVDRAPLDKELLELGDHMFLRITGPTGQTLIETTGIRAWLPDGVSIRRAPGAYWNVWRKPDRARLEVYSTPFRDGWLHLGRMMDSEDDLLRDLRASIVGFLVIGPILAAVLGGVLMGYGLAPLAELAIDAERIRPETLNARFRETEVPTELAPFVHALNHTLTRLQEAFQNLSELNGDLAHELRTPVHALLLDCEGLLRRQDLPEEALATLEGMVGTLDHLGAMIEQMLALARMEDPSRGIHPLPMDLEALALEAIAPFRSLAEEKGVTLRVDLGAPSLLHVDATLARRALHNLLANAIRHSSEGTCVCLRARREHGMTVLSVEDTGNGIPEELLAKVGRRFLRGDQRVDQAGSGLGLVIVKKIAELHGGSFRLSSRLGQGTLAELWFPES